MKTHHSTAVWQVPDSFRTIYSHAAEIERAHRMLFISGQVGVKPNGELVADFAGQCEQAMDNVEALLAAAGMARDALAKIIYFVTRTDNLAVLGEIRRRRWTSPKPPAVTVLAVAALARPQYLIEIEAIAVV